MNNAGQLQPDWLHGAPIKALAKAFASHQEQVRFVGGCVRDTLLGRSVSDIDLATSLPPDAVMELAVAVGLKAVPTGIKHGTVTVVAHEQPLEITTLRRDAACDGRHAAVEFTDDWQEDAARRDFTMNALYMSLTGELFDYTGGIEDAKAGRVRFIGEASKRIEEDYLRILRFFRFLAYYGKEPADPEALAACKAHADGLARLSGERIQQEMLKLLDADNPIPVLQLMEQNNVLDKLIQSPDINALQALLSAGQRTQTPTQPATRLATLMPEQEIAGVAGRWKLSNATRRDITGLYGTIDKIRAATTEHDQKQLLRAVGKKRYEQMVLFAMARDAADYSGMLALAKNWEIPEFPLTGEDLVQQGHAPGKSLGELLAKLESDWEASDYTLSKSDLLKAAK